MGSTSNWREYTSWALEPAERFAKLFDHTTEQIVVFDLETTGTDPATDEILQVAIIDGTGNQLLGSYTEPVRKRSWKET